MNCQGNDNAPARFLMAGEVGSQTMQKLRPASPGSCRCLPATTAFFTLIPETLQEGLGSIGEKGCPGLGLDLDSNGLS